MTNTTNHQTPLRTGGYLHRALATLLALATVLMASSIQAADAPPTSQLLTHPASAQVGTAPLRAEPTAVTPELIGVLGRVTRGIVNITADLGPGT